jgi:hypothetical protein
MRYIIRRGMQDAVKIYDLYDIMIDEKNPPAPSSCQEFTNQRSRAARPDDRYGHSREQSEGAMAG